MSNMLLLILFGNRFESFTETEVVSQTRDRVTVHIFSKRRVAELFSIDDVNLAKFHDLRTDNMYYLTPYATLLTKHGQTFKAYAWEQPDDNNIEFRSNTGTYVFQKPLPLLSENRERDEDWYDYESIPT